MRLENTVVHHLLNVIAHSPGIRIEDVAQLTPELSLREVVYTVLSESEGSITPTRQRPRGRRGYHNFAILQLTT